MQPKPPTRAHPREQVEHSLAEDSGQEGGASTALVVQAILDHGILYDPPHERLLPGDLIVRINDQRAMDTDALQSGPDWIRLRVDRGRRAARPSRWSP